MRAKKRRSEKVMQTRKGWRHADDVKRLRIFMLAIAMTTVAFMAAGGVTIWLLIRAPLQNLSGDSDSVQTASVSLPVYDDSFNLILVNRNKKLKEDFEMQLIDFKGIKIDMRIQPALEKMLKDAAEAGCSLKLTGGYVEKETQQAEFEAEVKRLMDSGGYTRIRAEDTVKTTVQPGEYSELQTGMAVQLVSAQTPDAKFETTEEYRWLEKNSIYYGFILRYPSAKTEVTGHIAVSTQFRYVGTEHAVKMRSLGMCLEEYCIYVRNR